MSSTNPRPKIIAFSNQKGGVGKTTATLNLGIYLASTGRQVLIVDTDPQANSTKSLTEGDYPGLYEALTCAERSRGAGSGYDIPEVMPNLFILSGSIRLASLEKSLIGEMDAYTRLRDLLSLPPFAPAGEKGLGDEWGIFEYILIDTPPSLGVLTINALTAAKYVIAPMSPAIYSLQGTNDLMATIAKVKKNLNPDLAFLGVIVNAYDGHPVIHRQIREEISASFGGLVFRTALSRSVKIEEAIAGRKGLVAGESKVGDEIKLIGEELIERVEKDMPRRRQAGSLSAAPAQEVQKGCGHRDTEGIAVHSSHDDGKGAGGPVPRRTEPAEVSGVEGPVPSGVLSPSKDGVEA